MKLKAEIVFTVFCAKWGNHLRHPLADCPAPRRRLQKQAAVMPGLNQDIPKGPAAR